MVLKKINRSIYISFVFVIIFNFISCAVAPKDYAAGNSYLNDTKYVEYLPGTLPIIITVPHGGSLMPKDIPNRDCKGCVYVKDLNTQELGRSIREEFFNKTGFYPHVVINLLNRKKFDANRDIEDAADGNPIVEKAWADFHQFIDVAKAKISKDYKRGLLLDIHGHAHKLQRLELGYLLNKKTLQLSDSILNTDKFLNRSSIRGLVNDNPQNLSHSELLRGENSLGSLFVRNGVLSVPSSKNPFPLNNEKFFSSGYNVQHHGSSKGGNIDAVLVECHRGVRNSSKKRKEFTSTFVKTVSKYIAINYNISILK